jgi:tRNA-Thr(GGU) m(6)t(6)A37 methyltransferase TsaA
MHKVKDFSLIVKPEISSEMRGVFSTRSPKRPNPIGFTVVKLIKIESLIIRIRGVDMLDSTPLIDIKPYIPESDSISKAKIGWLSNLNLFCF